MIEQTQQHWTHHTIPCAELDRRGHLPPEPPPETDVWLALLVAARRAQIHLEMRMELLREEERQAAAQ